METSSGNRDLLASLGSQARIVAYTVIVAIAATRAGTTAANAQEPPPRPIGASDLLRSEPFDRITLIDNSVVIVEPVSPRPLPLIDPRKEREKRLKQATNPVETFIEVGKEPKKEDEGSVEGRDIIKIHLLQTGRSEVRDFLVKRTSIKKIEYFEDLLLDEVDRLILSRDFARAFECCLRVKTRDPSWPGLDDRVNKVLYTEGRRALIDGDDERGLRLLRELLGRNRDYPDLLEQIVQAYGKRIERAVRMGRYVLGRRVLHELEGVVGERASVAALRSRFVSKATDRVQQAETKDSADRLDALAEALRIWPTLPGVEARYIEAFQAMPTLDVGVIDVASPPGPWVRSPADDRIVRLLYLPILAADNEDARKGKPAGQLAASVETSDLGRRMVIRLRPGPIWSDGSRPVSIADVARALIEQTDPHSPTYEARWAQLLDRAEVRGEDRIEVRLHHSPLKAGSSLIGPVGAAHAGVDGRIVLSARRRMLVTDGPFGCSGSEDDRLELRTRSDSSSDGAIRRIREIRLSRGSTAVTALRRGDVTMIDHVPPDQVAAMTGAQEIQIGQYQRPVVHVLAVDGRTPALRNRALRRGLSYAIHRKGLLEETVLKHPANDVDTPADGPFARGSFADAADVKPLAFDILLAKMLVAAARKELGARSIRLKLDYPAIPECRAVVPKLAEAFQIAGVEIELAEWPESRLEGELRAGRRFDLAYRVLRCDDPIGQAGPLLCPAYDAPPEADPLASAASPRILQLLLQLERAGEWATARGLVAQIDRESRNELPVIPLWQLADHYAWRSRLRGPEATTSRLYDGIERWQVAPWVAHDPWDPGQKPEKRQ